VGEPVRLVARVRIAREFNRPVGELEAQRVPTLSSPASAHLSPFEHDMLQAAPLQYSAHRQSGLTAPDNDDVVMLAHTRPNQRTDLGSMGVGSIPTRRIFAVGRLTDRRPSRAALTIVGAAPSPSHDHGPTPCTDPRAVKGSIRDCHVFGYDT
jgi:hypothetical protein